MIRPAKLSDIDKLVELGREFHDEAGMHRLAPYDEGSSRQTLFNMIHTTTEPPGAAVLVAENSLGAIVGAIGACIFPIHFNRAVLGAQELFWWLLPEYRSGGKGIAMLKAMEAHMRSRGVAVFSMLMLYACAPEKMASLFDANGYACTEAVWWKRL